ncbi:MAG: sulfatase-like hydrolase/transferase [Caldilineaceae bacterium]|nr:sulfatase-like hydrolase/transferase [Caldilineaceae bacterium]
MANARRVIVLFLDGVGIGADDPAVNPLAAAVYPTLERLLAGRRAVTATGRFSTALAELVPTDAQMGIPGRPQSATGQAAILTGINAPQRLGEHYGPRPDNRVRAILDEGSIFRRLCAAGRSAYFCNAYPQRYFDAVQRGKRLLSAVPYAAVVGGQSLLTHADILAGRALAADFTNQSWRDELGYTDAPVYTPDGGGRMLWELAQPHDFIFFEHWYTDLLGHNCALEEAVRTLQRFDAFLGGLLAAADLDNTLIIVTSDHGNVEDCSIRKHTENPALTLLCGAERARYAERVTNLTDLLPAVFDFLEVRQ